MKFLLAPVCRPAADRIRPKAPRRILARAAFWCGLVVLGIALGSCGGVPWNYRPDMRVNEFMLKKRSGFSL